MTANTADFLVGTSPSAANKPPPRLNGLSQQFTISPGSQGWLSLASSPELLTPA